MNPVLALIITNIIWGAASPIFKLALTNIPPFTLAFIRFFFGGLIFLPFALTRWQKMRLFDWWEMMLVGFFGVSVNITFFFLGLPKTTSINAPIIASAGPVFLFILSVIFLKERPRFKVLIGMLVALAGVMVIIFSPVIANNQKLHWGEIEGNFFFVLATLGAVLQTLVCKKVMKRFNPYQVSAVSFLFGSATFTPMMIRELDYWRFDWLNFNGWLGIIFGVFFSTALAYFLFYYGVSKIQAQEVGLYTYIDPVVAVIIALPLLHEIPTVYYFFGSWLVFGGIYIAERRIHYHPFYRLKAGHIIRLIK